MGREVFERVVEGQCHSLRIGGIRRKAGKRGDMHLAGDEPSNMTLERVGYGAGRKTFAIPNVVRVMIGERTPV